MARSPRPRCLRPAPGTIFPVTVGDLMTATLLYLSAPTLTPGYFPALSAAAAGNGAPLRTVAIGLETDLNGNSSGGRPLGHHLQRRRRLIRTVPPPRHWPDRWPPAFLSVAPKLWPTTSSAVRDGPRRVPQLAHLAPIRSSPPSSSATRSIPTRHMPWRRRLAPAVGGRLVTYVGYGHSWLLNGSANACMQTVVSDYLIDETLPAPGTRCAASN